MLTTLFVDRKNFMMGPYPMFSMLPIDNRKPLTFYGEENFEEPDDVDINQEAVEVQ
jgi:hypothetical protein